MGKGSGVPVHISHLKASGKPYWGTVGSALERIVAAREAGQLVTADQYPYIASSTQLAAMVVPHWAVQGNADNFARLAADPARGRSLRREIQRELDERDGGASVRIARYAPRPEWAGLDLVAIAGRTGTTPLEVVLDIQRHGGAQAISFGMCEPDVREVMRHEFVATASDGSTHLPGRDDHPHPRAYGTFPRKIRYALDEKVISLEQAIRSCSGWPAQILGLPDRGVIREGAVADLVVFDPETFRDAATFDQPTRYATGVKYLFVNGVALIAEGGSRWNRRRSGSCPAGRCGCTGTVRPTLIVKVGRIWTGDRDHPWAEALAARDGAIAAVGAVAEVMRLRGPSTRVIDRPDAFAMPGLIDAHGHMESLGREQGRARPARGRVARRGRPTDQGAGRRDARRLMDHGAELGPESLAGRRVPDCGRARRSGPASAGLASAGRRSRRLGQLRGDAAGERHQGIRRLLPTARSSVTTKGGRRVSSSTGP